MTWQHIALFICPSGFETNANAVATAVQHQPGDSATFGNVWYAESGTPGTKFVSVANTRMKDETLAVLEDPALLPSPPPNGADPMAVQTAIAALVAYQAGGTYDLTKDFLYAVDQDPQTILTALGLVPWVDPNAPSP